MPEQEIIVMARNKHEMEAAQTELVAWAGRKVGRARADFEDLEANVAKAREAKWAVKPWERRAAIAKKRVIYYEKIMAALEAGFVIVPNFPMSTFAIRTSKGPRKNLNSSKASWNLTVKAQEPDGSPVGAGENVNPFALQNTWREREKDEDGDKVRRHYTESDEHDEVDFPLAMAKPLMLADTSRAMALKIFDELGVLPEGGRGDPMVIGQVKFKNGYTERSVSFLIAWWVDSREL